MANPTCYAPDCRKRVDEGTLMCKPHWFQVPLRIRRRVWAAWTAFKKEPSVATVRAYRAARDEARDSLLPMEAARG